jgi:hypothetical protein
MAITVIIFTVSILALACISPITDANNIRPA